MELNKTFVKKTLWNRASKNRLVGGTGTFGDAIRKSIYDEYRLPFCHSLRSWGYEVQRDPHRNGSPLVYQQTVDESGLAAKSQFLNLRALFSMKSKPQITKYAFWLTRHRSSVVTLQVTRAKFWTICSKAFSSRSLLRNWTRWTKHLLIGVISIIQFLVDRFFLFIVQVSHFQYQSLKPNFLTWWKNR